MAKKYKKFIICISENSISLTRDERQVIGNNETGLILVDTSKQEVYQLLDTKGLEKKVIYKGL